MKFGEKLRIYRREKGVSLRNLATVVNITPTYLSDVENCKTKAPNKELVNQFIKNLNLISEESVELIELAAEERNEIPADIYEAIISTPAIKKLIRAGIETKARNDVWERMLEILIKSVIGRK